MTIEEFISIATESAEDYELVDGELIPFPSQSPLHSHIRSLMSHILHGYFKENSAGIAFAGIDWTLDSCNVRRVDVGVIIGVGKIQRIDWDKAPVPFAPDIAIEILSPNERAMDVRRRVRDYLRAGTAEVWLLDHANGEVHIWTASGNRVFQSSDSIESALLPGFQPSVDALVNNH